MIGNLFGPSGAGDILKTVFKATPMGVASGAISDIFKSTGIMDDIGKLLDGVVSKPKPGGLGNIGKMVQKMAEQLQQQKGLPTGLMPMDFFDGPAGGVSGAARAAAKAVQSAAGAIGGKAGAGAVSGAMSGMIGGKAGAAAAAGGGVAGGGMGGAMAGMGGGLAGMAQKAIFITTLQQAIQKAATQQNFNLETAINDVWIKLSGLRPQGRQDLQELNQMFQMLEGISRQMNEMQKSAIRNMR